MAKKLNLIEVIQKWMDTMAGQTFMNYAYSWGAAVVILGTLFKLTHLPGANLMLFIGMGTEVFVFIVAGFERVTERVPGAEGAALSSEAVEGLAAVASAAAQNTGGVVVGGGPAIVGGGPAVVGGGLLHWLPGWHAHPQPVSHQSWYDRLRLQDGERRLLYGLCMFVRCNIGYYCILDYERR